MTAYQEAKLDALGDATRRAILARLLDGPAPVGKLAHGFPMSRPAISQHLRILKDANLVVDPLFAEAPLAGPKIPLLKMRVAKWAVVARLLWHAGYHPGIENYASARARAKQAADILTAKVMDGGAVALVAHGYFNAMIGRQLRRRGFHRTGSHQVRYWNAVTYDWK